MEYKESLKKTGVAVIPNVLTKHECQDVLNSTWDFFEHITTCWETPLSRNNEKTWNQIYNLYPSHGMLFQHWNIGQSDAVWKVRTNQNVIDVFSNIWSVNSEDLLVSFDGMSFALPHEVTKRGYYRNKNWFHCDQSFTSSDFKCVQGFVTACDVNEDDATFAYYEGSHLLHENLGKEFGINLKENWYKLNQDEESWIQNKCGSYKKIVCPAGSLVLWDSRTIHCGIQAIKDRKESNNRCVVYVSYQPRSMCSNTNIKKRIKAFESQRMTTHWASTNVKLFPKNPRTYGKLMPTITQTSSPVIKNDIMRKLIGY